MTRQEFIDCVAPIIITDSNNRNLLPSPRIAQAIKESKSGTSELAQAPAFNLFGIKDNNQWSGGTYNIDTKECYDNVNMQTVSANFQVHGSWEQSVYYQGEYLEKRWISKTSGKLRFERLKGVRDYKQFCNLLEECNYATDPDYAEGLIKLIEQHDLTRFDAERIDKMKIALVVGHSRLKNGNYTSANGVYNEYLYNKELAPLVKAYLEKLGHNVTLVICPEGQFAKSTEEKAYKLNIINNGNFDLVVELHLNAGGGTGSEVLYISNKGKAYADKVQDKLATIFKDRGVKKRDNLYMLTQTNPVSIMIESFFCDSKTDCEIGADKELLARLIAEGITGQIVTGVGIEPAEPKLYRVQCGAFRNLANAEAYRDIIIDMGYQAFVKYISPYYKVQVGAFSVKANAEKLSKELSAKGIGNFIV